MQNLQLNILLCLIIEKRNVSITGEAYFEVVTDKNRKFLVNVNGTVAEVTRYKF